MKGYGWRTKLNGLSKKKKIALILSIVVTIVVAISGTVYVFKKNSAKVPKPNIPAVSNGKAKENKKELTAEQKKLANENEKARSAQKNKNEKCNGYYEQLEKYSKAFSDRNTERSKKIRDLGNKYQIDSDEYKRNLQEINKQYSNILKNNAKPPSKPENC